MNPLRKNYPLLASALLLILVMGGYSLRAQQAPSLSMTIEGPSHFETPLMDYLGYKQMRVRLPNGIQAWLISAPDSERSCLGVSVGVGSGDDPFEHIGLSHFVEHTLFLGSEHYPEEGDFNRFVTSHSGSTNAFTSPDRTVYGISCESKAWSEAVSRLSDFIVFPLLAEASHLRERTAIDEEFQKNIVTDSFLSLHVLLDQASPSHPMHKLIGGNKETLAKAGSIELKAWVKQHYVGSNMGIFALSSEPLEKMKEALEKGFASLPKGSTDHAPWPELFDEGITAHDLWVHAPSDQSLLLNWSFPLLNAPQSACAFLQKCIDHPELGGLSDSLKKKGWISSLGSSGYPVRGLCLFEIQFQLTPLGFEHIDEIRSLAFDYLQFIQQSPWPEIWLAEAQNSSSVNWQLHVSEPKLSQALSTASLLLDEPLETFPKVAMWPTPEALDEAKKYSSYLSPTRCVTLIMGPESTWPEKVRELGQSNMGLHEEPWTHTKYIKCASKPTVLSHKKWSLPATNPLLPLELPLFKIVKSSPYSCASEVTGLGSLYQLPNSYQAASRDSLILAWSCPHLEKPSGSSRDQSLSERSAEPQTATRAASLAEQTCYWALLADCLTQQLECTMHNAQDAGQSLSLSPKFSGIEFTLSGYQGAAQDKLLMELAGHLAHIKSDPDLFTRAKESQRQSLLNSINEGPLSHFRSALAASLLQEKCSQQALLDALLPLSYERFQAWVDAIQHTPWQFDLIIVSERPTSHWKELFEKINPSSQAASPHPGSGKPESLPVPFDLHWRPMDQSLIQLHHGRESGNMVVYLWPLASPTTASSTDDYLYLQLLQDELQTKANHELRTIRQLGYVVQCQVSLFADRPTLMLIVLSSSYEVAALKEAMDQFYHSMSSSISQWDSERFEKSRDLLLFDLQETPSSSLEQLARMKATLWQLHLQPKKQEQWIDAARALTLQSCHVFVKRLFSTPPVCMTLTPNSRNDSPSVHSNETSHDKGAEKRAS